MVLDQKSKYLYVGPYLSNLARYLYETFRVTCWGSTKLIHDDKDDFVFQVLGQEPLISSNHTKEVLDQKSEFLDIGPYLGNLTRYWHEAFRVTSWGFTNLIHDDKDDLVLQVLDEELLTSSKYDHQGKWF